MTVPDTFISPAEAARLLGTTVAALAQHRRRNTGPAYEIRNGRVYYRAENIAASTASTNNEGFRPLLTAAQVAQLLAVTTSALTHLRGRREGPAWVNIGRSVRYRPEDVEHYIAQNRRNAASQ